MKEHVELVNKINDETNNPEVELSKSKDLIVYDEQMPTITDTDGKTYSIADIIDMDLPELIELKQKVPDLEIKKNFFNFLYRNYEVLYKGSQIISRRGDTERILHPVYLKCARESPGELILHSGFSTRGKSIMRAKWNY